MLYGDKPFLIPTEKIMLYARMRKPLICFLTLIFSVAVQFGTQSAAQETIISKSKSPEIALRDARKNNVPELTSAQVRSQSAKFRNSGNSQAPTCGHAACMCVGGSDCLILVDSGKCKSGFHCLPTNEGPSCVCSQ